MAALTLLRAAPLLGATSSVTFTVSEDIFMRALAYPPFPEKESDYRRHVNRVLPAHGRWLWPGLAVVFTTYPFSMATAVANLNNPWRDGRLDMALFHGDSRQRWTAGFYLAGFSLSLLHMAWGPRAMHLLSTIRRDNNIETDPMKDNTAAQRAWITLNAVRGFWADVPSMVCYFMAFILSFS